MRRWASGLLLALTALAVHAQSSQGEVRKIDKAQGRITLQHDGVASLDMPPMAMVFRVRDPALLERVAVGDRVRFEAARIDGQYTVTAITKAP